MTEFDSSLKNYCRRVGVGEKTVFILVHAELSRALSAYECWRHKGTPCKRVMDFLREDGERERCRHAQEPF